MFKRFMHHGKEEPLPADAMPTEAETGDDGIQEFGDSPNRIEFFSNGQILKTIKANVARTSEAGPNVRTRLGILLALDETDDDQLFKLDLRGKSILQFFKDLHQGNI
jgi:hypothetical protein